MPANEPVPLRLQWLAAVLSLALAAAAAPAEYDLEVDASSLPGVVETASTLEVRVEAHNAGRHRWAAEDGFAMSYHWRWADGTVALWDGVRAPFVEPVEPAGSREVAVSVRAPDRAGDYLLQWDVVQEGVRWLSEVDPTPVASVPIRVVATHAFSAIEVDTPRVLVAGARRRAHMVVRNDGTGAWPGDGSVSIAAHWFASDGSRAVWEGRRTPIDGRVVPGGTAALEAVVEAPAEPGRYRLQWDMVDEGVCWFAERDGSPEPEVVVVVLPSGAVSPAVWAALTLAAAIAAVRLSGRGRRVRGRDLWGAAGVFWLVAAMTVKQAVVLDDAGSGLAPGGWCLSAATVAVLGLLLLALPRRVRPVAVWTVALVGTAVLFADAVHGRFFGDLGSVAALRSLGQIGQVEASVGTLIRVDDVWFWADLVPAAVLLAAAVRLAGADSSRRRPAVVLGIVATLGACCGTALFERAGSSLRQVFHATELARHVGVLNLHLVDLGRSSAAGLTRRELGRDERDGVVAYFDDRRPLRAGTGPAFAVAAGCNLIMLQVESLQAFVIDLQVEGREVTPFLNDLAKRNFRFANVTDQTEEGRSSDAELATQVSLLPPDQGAAAFLYAGNRYTGLAAVLRDRGYRTVSAVPFDGSFWNRRTTHRSYGFDRSWFAEDFEPGPSIGWGLNDADFLAQTAARLDDLPEPWCAYLLTLSLHHPFEGFPAARKVLDVGDWEGTPFGNFLHTMHFMDGALASFVAALDRAGLLERTVLAVWGDHDAGFEWRPEIAAAMGVPADSGGWYLSQRVPLVIRVPGVVGPGRPLEVPAGHVDVAPTLAALLGIDPSPYPWLGRNLLGEPGPGPVVGEYRCFTDSTHLYLRRGPALADGECLDLDGLKPAPVVDCSAAFERARRQVEISTTVLEHDLQETVRAALSADLDAQRTAP